MTVRQRLPRRGFGSRSLPVIGILVLAMALAVAGLATGASAAHRASTTNLDATDATSASLAWSAATFDSATDAAIGRDDKFPDNLASALIQGRFDAPLLLNNSETLENAVLNELRTLGVTNVHALGGTSALSPAVIDALRANGFTVHRDSGVTRIETAIDIARRHGADATQALLVRAFGTPAGDETQAWADALAAGGWAADQQIPVLLTQTERLNDNLRAYLETSSITTITIVGGNAAVSPVVATELAAMGITVRRVSGPNRFATAVEVAKARGFADASEADKVILVEGQSPIAWSSGFSAAAHSAQHNAPIVLSNGANVPPETLAWLAPGTQSTALLCGPFVTDAACDTARAEFEPVVPATVTARPELLSAQIVSLTTPGQATGPNPQGTRIRYTFDEELGTFGGLAPVANRFHAYSADNTRFTGTDFVVDTGNRSVTVRFATLETQEKFDVLTLATVARDAVFDPQGNGSPEGDRNIGTAGQTSVGQAGITSAPDLTNVDNFRDAFQVGQTAVDFHFDQNAFRTTGVPGDFKLVMVDGTEIDCTTPASGSTTPGGQTNVGGEGTTRITVVCTNPGGTPGTVAGTAITASNVARGVVEANAVAATTAQVATPGDAAQNPLHAHDVSPSITTPRPDLVSATFEPGATGVLDGVTYTFDQTVTAAAVALFNVYRTDGTEVSAVAPQTATINPQNASQVRVTYPNGTLANAVGASAEEGAATGSGGVNRDDEVGVANVTNTTRTPGVTTGPNLTAVALDRGTDQFGNTTDYRVTYTFDEPVDPATVTASRFHLYLADGTRLDGVTCTRVAAIGAAAGTTGENQVRCTVTSGTSVQVGSSVLGTVEFDAVDDLDGQPSTEGARVASGSTGTPQQ